MVVDIMTRSFTRLSTLESIILKNFVKFFKVYIFGIAYYLVVQFIRYGHQDHHLNKMVSHTEPLIKLWIIILTEVG